MPESTQPQQKPPAAARRTSASWVPIRSLAPRHRNRIQGHLLALGEADRHLRFGYCATDEQIIRYVASLDFKRDEIFGVFDRRLELIGLAHLAYSPAPQRSGKAPMAEFGVSVTQRGRGRGLGGRLFARAMLHARNRAIDTIFIHALSENAVMLRIARRAGASVEREGSESTAWLKLPQDTISSHVEEVLSEQAAGIDYQVKMQARWVDRLWSRISDPFLAERRRANRSG